MAVNKTLVDWLNGINPMYAGGITPQYFTGENNLQQALASRLFEAQGQENAANQAYERGMGDVAQQEPIEQRQFRYGAANRGTLQSGMTVRGLSDIGSQFNRLRAQLGENKMTQLANAAAGRTNAYSAFGQGESELQANIAQQGMNALATDAQQQAAIKSAQAEADYQQQMLDLQKQIYQGMNTADQAGAPAAINPYTKPGDAAFGSQSFIGGGGTAYNTQPRINNPAVPMTYSTPQTKGLNPNSFYSPASGLANMQAKPSLPSGYNSPNQQPKVPQKYYRS